MSWLFSAAMMKAYGSLPCSLGLAEEYSEATCSDGEQSAPLSGNPMQLAYLPPDRMTAFSRHSRFGMTFRPLTASRGAELLMWYLAASHVRTSALQARALELKGHDPACGSTWRASLARFDPVSCSWKTVQHSLLGDSDESSVIWPRSGMTASGQCWELPMLERRIRETGSGLWATPTVCGNYNRKGVSKTSGDGLATQVKRMMYPTPQASDNRNRGNADTPAIARRIAAGKQVMLTMTVSGGQLNPTWVEWLMGWPLGWTDLKPLEMGKFQQWQQQQSGE